MPRHSGGELSSEERREICGRCGLDAAVSRCWFCWGTTVGAVSASLASRPRNLKSPKYFSRICCNQKTRV